jgi:hypothetical protein
MNVYEALLGIVPVPSYIPGGAWSFSKFISLLLWIVGFPIALWLIWLALRWMAKKACSSVSQKMTSTLTKCARAKIIAASI